ncbi:MAG: DinB family protein [Actinomycetes bacterium]
MAIERDTKDWTWVLTEVCGECGYDASAVDLDDVPDRIRTNAAAWAGILADRPDVRERPDDQTWSPLEYACHVRDVHVTFDQRVRLMLETDDPAFENWDQDATAVERRYGEQDPMDVAEELRSAAARVSSRYGAVKAAAWERTGRRSDGAVFTVGSLARYHLHDLEHHLHDVIGTTSR